MSIISDLKANERNTYKKAHAYAKNHFHRWIRLRDTQPQGWAPCISCGRPYSYEMLQAGHYIPATYRHLEFNEYNVNAQCVQCNAFKEGNQVAYRERLSLKIGLDKVVLLESLKRGKAPDKWQLKIIGDEYKNRIIREYGKEWLP